MRLLPIACLAFALTAAPALAQDFAALEQAEAGVTEVWDAMPLGFRKVLLVTDAPAYGVYTQKPDSSFAAGELIMIYTEPVGFGYLTNADGTYQFGFNFDLTIKNAAGDVVLEQPDFATANFTSHAKNREFLVTVTLDLDGAPAGDYVLEYLARDIASEKTATFSVPVTIAQ